MKRQKKNNPDFLNFRSPRIELVNKKHQHNKNITLRFRTPGLRISRVPSSPQTKKKENNKTVFYSLAGGVCAGLGLLQNPVWFFLAFAMGVFALFELFGT